MERKESASIKIDTSFYAALGRMDISTEGAFKEFIDNSTTSFLDHENELKNSGAERCEVRITWTEDEIIISDNAYGMKKNDFLRALKLNAKAESYTKTSRGQYGIGLKYAAANLGNWYSIESTEYGSMEKYYAVMDIEEIEKTNTEEVEMTISNTLGHVHGTKIVIRKLFIPFSTFNAGRKKKGSSPEEQLIRKLSAIYSKDLQYKKLDLYFNGKKITYNQPQFMKNPETGSECLEIFEESFTVGDATYNYSGWIGVLETGDTSNAGFALFQRDRAIQLNYRPEELFGKSNDFRHQRIVGEIYLDGDNWIVSFTKSGMKWGGNGQHEAFLESIMASENIMYLFNLAKKYRKKDENVDAKSLSRMKLDSAFKSLEKVEKPVATPVPATKTVAQVLPVKVDANNDTISSGYITETVDEEKLEITYEGIKYELFLIPSVSGEMQNKWILLKVRDFEKNQYDLHINTRVSMFEDFAEAKSKKLITKMAVSIALAQLSSKRLGLDLDKTQLFVEQINSILNNSN